MRLGNASFSCNALLTLAELDDFPVSGAGPGLQVFASLDRVVAIFDSYLRAWVLPGAGLQLLFIVTVRLEKLLTGFAKPRFQLRQALLVGAALHHRSVISRLDLCALSLDLPLSLQGHGDVGWRGAAAFDLVSCDARSVSD